MNQKIKIHLTQNRRQRPLRDIIDELSDFINENGVQMPESLVSKKKSFTSLRSMVKRSGSVDA